MKKSGFTLIELVLVVALIGIIAMIVLPRLDPYLPERRLKSAARLLSGTISLAYGEAIAKNKKFRLYFNTMEDRYWIVEVRVPKEDENDVKAPGIRLGTQFELLQYEDGSRQLEQHAPTEPMFAPKTLPDGVRFQSVEIGSGREMAASELPFIEFDPLGRANPAKISLLHDDGERLVIEYDGITGMPRLFPLEDSTG